MSDRKFLAAAAGALIALFLPLATHAHATPVSYMPAASSVSEEVPQAVRITFSERPDLGASSIAVYGPDGARVDEGPERIAEGDPWTLTVGIRGGQEGTFTVSWQVVSADDGHFTKGAFPFSVGIATATGASGSFSISHSSSTPEAVTIWLELMGLALLLGALAVLLTFGTGAGADARRRIAIMGCIGAVLAVVGAAAGFALKAFELSLAQSISLAEAFGTYLRTTAGTATAARGALAAFAGAGHWVLQRGPHAARQARMVIVAALAGWVFARARVSHAAASHVLPGLSVAVNALHLLAKAAWIGGAAVLAFAVLPGRARMGEVMRASARWGRVAAAMLAATGVTGAYVTWLHLKDFGNVLTSDWGGLFLVLAVSGAAAAVVRFHLTFSVEPRAGRGHDVDPSWHVLAEAFLGAVMLFATSQLIITTPPLDARPYVSRSVVSEGVRLSLEAVPTDDGALLLSADDPSGAPSRDAVEAIVTATRRDVGIGPIVIPASLRRPGLFAIDRGELSPPGPWSLDVTVRRAGHYDATGTFAIDTPGDIDAGRAANERRRFGDFEAWMIAAALLSIAAGAALHRKARSSLATAGDGGAAWRGIEWLTPLATAIIAAILLQGLHATVFKGRFQLACEANGHAWMTSAPMREGIATAARAANGCSVGNGAGAWHFVDALEYAEFIRPASPSVELISAPDVPKAGERTTLFFRMKEDGKPLGGLVVEHERLLHAIVVSRDFGTYAHAHVEDVGPVTPAMREAGVFPVDVTFPRGGRYLVSVDFAVRAAHFSRQFLVDVEGEPATGAFVLGEATGRTAEVDGYTVRLSTSPRALRSKDPVRLRFNVMRDGKPVTDLEPHLGAGMHVAVVKRGFGWEKTSLQPERAGLDWRDHLARLLFVPSAAAHPAIPDFGTNGVATFTHAHGMPRPTLVERLLRGRAVSGVHRMHASLPAAFGPDIDTDDISFAEPGAYVIFAEFRHSGAVHVAKFLLDVRR